jgi:hypothetical protein
MKIICHVNGIITRNNLFQEMKPEEMKPEEMKPEEMKPNK